jgi:hypothetical protein
MAGRTPKGDPLLVAQIAGVQAAKRTAELIPLCHPLPLTQIDVQLEADAALPGVRGAGDARLRANGRGDGGADGGECGAADRVRHAEGAGPQHDHRGRARHEQGGRTQRRASRRVVISLFVAAAMFTLGAAAAREPGLEFLNVALERELKQARRTLKARSGELQLARLELQRLNTDRGILTGRTGFQPTSPQPSTTSRCQKGSIRPLAFSLVRVESGFTRRAISSAGAVGFTQVMPSTAFWLQPGLKYATSSSAT